MSTKLEFLGWMVTLSLITAGSGMAQPVPPAPVKPSGPAAKKKPTIEDPGLHGADREGDRARATKKSRRLRAEWCMS